MNAIEIKSVSKKYRIYHDKSTTLKEHILFFKRTRYEEHQVINGISFNIEKGTTIGLIGQNGSGKSTLLKLLSGIIYPDEGTIETNGRVSSLLELGAGFHPDFSGRENIYNNASIFGLSRNEIDKRYNQIVEFSELQEFIDNPVRTYSSGMYMRLAFAVAINVDADILLIDEILAVGDANFQKKCMDKIKDLKREGKTIVIVTHDMGAVEKICDKAIWLNNGEIKHQGDAYETINSYMEYMAEMQNKERPNEKEFDNAACDISNETEANNCDSISKKRWGNKDIVIDELRLLDKDSVDKKSFKSGEQISVSFSYTRHNISITNPVFGVGIFRNDGVNCYGTNTQIDRISNIVLKDKGIVNYVIDNLNLLEGHYSVDVAVVSEDGFPYDYIRNITEFDVHTEINDIGVIRLTHHWIVDNTQLS